MKRYQKLNNIVGWSVFGVALITYFITVEDSASLWDCGEFIAANYKLEIGHPPGAPLFMLLGRFFSLFSTDVENIAYMVNLISVFASAFTILFLFWTITIMARKLLKIGNEGPNEGQIWAILGSGAIGALAYAYSDSFWFSAGEAEVYALSSFFTAIVFWAILKWEEVADKPGSDRWIILIAYMIGLSTGVHLLNLLAIPALGFIYYFKKYKEHTFIGGLVTFVVSGVILVLIQNGVIIMLPSIAQMFEITFVNTLGLPFSSGITFFIFLLIAALVFGLYYSIKKQKQLLNTILLSFAFILIGYSTFTIIIIRSQYNTPLNENDPGRDLPRFVSYLKREQYGDWAVFRGPQFTARYEGEDPDTRKPVYMRGDDEYVVYRYKAEPKWEESHVVLFPRMSRGSTHGEYYRKFLLSNTDWRPDTLYGPNGQKQVEEPLPTKKQNFQYMFQVQMGKMYWRYFGWNFIGRYGDEVGRFQSDDVVNTAAAGVLHPGNMNEPVPTIYKSKARNNYFMLPLILGCCGLVFQVMRDKKSALVVGTLFFLTGLAIIIYLNAPPIEPRERDYAYVGSFYAFAIWIGLGVLFLYDVLLKPLKDGKKAAVVATAVTFIVPAIMAQQGWDDHDRSGRYLAVDSAKNMLKTCKANAILFTGGDNDTFPLWYAQEVEGIRTDVRVCNLSLLNTAWYIDQMKLQAYKSDPLPITLTSDRYYEGTNDYFQVLSPRLLQYTNKSQPTDSKTPVEVSQLIDAIQKNSPSLYFKYAQDMSESHPYLPFVRMKVSFDAEAIKDRLREDPTFLPKDLQREEYQNTMVWNLGMKAHDKKTIIILDMIANVAKDGWKRPIYFANTMGNDNYMGLFNYLTLEGTAYRLLPVSTNKPRAAGGRPGHIHTDLMYSVMMDSTSFRGLNDASIFYDGPHRQMPSATRQLFLTLSQSLLAQGDKERAREAMHYLMESIPHEVIPYSVLYPGAREFMEVMVEAEAYEDLAKFGKSFFRTTVEDIEIFTKKAEEAKLNMNKARSMDARRAYSSNREFNTSLAFQYYITVYYLDSQADKLVEKGYWDENFRNEIKAVYNSYPEYREIVEAQFGPRVPEPEVMELPLGDSTAL